MMNSFLPQCFDHSCCLVHFVHACTVGQQTPMSFGGGVRRSVTRSLMDSHWRPPWRFWDGLGAFQPGQVVENNKPRLLAHEAQLSHSTAVPSGTQDGLTAHTLQPEVVLT